MRRRPLLTGSPGRRRWETDVSTHNEIAEYRLALHLVVPILEAGSQILPADSLTVARSIRALLQGYPDRVPYDGDLLPLDDPAVGPVGQPPAYRGPWSPDPHAVTDWYRERVVALENLLRRLGALPEDPSFQAPSLRGDSRVTQWSEIGRYAVQAARNALPAPAPKLRETVADD